MFFDKKTRAYYLARAGLELAYGAMNANQEYRIDGVDESMNYLTVLTKHDSSKLNDKKLGEEWKMNEYGLYQIEQKDFEIKKNKDVKGYVTVTIMALDEPSVNLCQKFGVTKDKHGNLDKNTVLFRVVSQGKIHKESAVNSDEVYTMTMTVRAISPREIRYYNGDYKGE